MSWYDENYLYRVPVSFPNVSGGTKDGQFTVPADWDLFWDAIQADGDDVRLTQPDGLTLVTYDVQSFTYASRILILEFDAVVMNDGCNLLWLYFGYASAVAGNSAFAPAGAIDGYIHLGKPEGTILDVTQEAADVTVPTQQIGKTSAAEIYVWWRMGGLETRRDRYNLHADYEEVELAYNAYVLLATVSQAGMIDATTTRFVYDTDGRSYIRMLLKAGSSGTDYTVQILVTTVVSGTTTLRLLTGRARLAVYDPAEP